MEGVGEEIASVSSAAYDADVSLVESQSSAEQSLSDVQESEALSQTLQSGNTRYSYVTTHSHVTPTSSHVMTSGYWTTTSLEKRNNARREAELIHARGRIVQLEVEVSELQRAAKRSRIEVEEEDEGEGKRGGVSKELERLHALDQERQSLTEQLVETQSLLEEREKEVAELRAKQESAMAASERQSREHRAEMEELVSRVNSLSNKNSHLSTQLSLVRSEAEVVREGLEEELRRQKDSTQTLRQRVKELEGQKSHWEGTQERVRELEHRLKQQKHDVQFAEVVQSRLLHYEDMERELRQLREEKEALQSRSNNVDLMQYQLQTLRERVERYEDMERRVAQLEEENRALQKSAGREGSREAAGKSSPALQCKLAELQHREVILLSQLGDLESRLKLAQRAADKAEAVATETQEQLAREQEECGQRGEKIQRLEKRLLFVSKERDGCVNVLNSYRLDAGVDALLKENLAEVEQQLAAAKDRIAQLEVELEGKASDLAAVQRRLRGSH